MITSYKNIIVFISIIFIFISAEAEEVYFDLSEDNIEIKTDFEGKEIIIFGLLQNGHETLLTIKGPPTRMKIQKKKGTLVFGLITNKLFIAKYQLYSFYRLLLKLMIYCQIQFK